MNLLHPRTRGFFAYFARAYPGRTLMMVLLLLVGGLLEGVSVITLVPVLEVAAGAGTGEAPSEVGQIIQNALLSVGIEPTLRALVAVVILGITLKAIVIWIAMRQVGFTVAEVTLDLRLKLVRALLTARWRYFGEQTIGSFANSITREAVRSSAAYQESCVVLGQVLQVLVYLLISALISWQVTLVAIVSGGVLLWGLGRFVEMGREAGNESARLTKSLSSRLVDGLQGIKPMKAMAREELFLPLLERDAEALNQAQRRNVIAVESLRLFQEPAVTLILGIGLVLLLSVGDQTFSAVVVLAFVFYRLMSHVNTLQMRYQTMVAGEGMFWSLREQIDAARGAEERHPGTVQPDGLRKAVELRNVGFAYDGLQVLKDVDMRIEAGSLTSLIGPSGSGKSTILDLITGLRRPDQGEVFLDGMPLEEVDLRSWRKLIGYVPQEVFLFHDTIRRNVTLGDDIPDERVLEALKDAGAWDFVAREEAGLDHMISPQGSNLSGGQRQRLAIARALVKSPALIVLDEATTGLDTETERAILQTLASLRGRVTILAVSHQPALREAADVTLELEGGKIIEAEPSAPRPTVRG